MMIFIIIINSLRGLLRNDKMCSRVLLCYQRLSGIYLVSLNLSKAPVVKASYLRETSTLGLLCI